MSDAGMNRTCELRGLATAEMQAAAELIVPRIRSEVHRLPDPLRTVASYHFGWRDRLGQPVESEMWQELCAPLVLAAAQAAGGDRARVADVAAAVRLTHDGCLLNEDVLAGRLTLAGQRTTWMVFGRAEAIHAGDALLVLGLDLLSRTDPALVCELNGAVLELLACRWLSLDDSPASQAADATTMSGTGALFGAACALGALAAGGRSAQVDALRQFGRRLGQAAMLADYPERETNSTMVATTMRDCSGSDEQLLEVMQIPRPEPEPQAAGPRSLGAVVGEDVIRRRRAAWMASENWSAAIAELDASGSAPAGADLLLGLATAIMDRPHPSRRPR